MIIQAEIQRRKPSVEVEGVSVNCCVWSLLPLSLRRSRWTKWASFVPRHVVVPIIIISLSFSARSNAIIPGPRSAGRRRTEFGNGKNSYSDSQLRITKAANEDTATEATATATKSDQPCTVPGLNRCKMRSKEFLTKFESTGMDKTKG